MATRTWHWAAALALVPLVVACDRHDDGDGTTINIGGGNAGAAMDAAGKVKIDTPVFKGEFHLPRVQMSAENFDIDGVHLYPGSRIAGVDVSAGEDAKGDEDGRVTVRFASPADVLTVRDWFAGEFRKAGTKVSVDGNAVKGQAEDKPFVIDLTPDGARTTGVVRIG